MAGKQRAVPVNKSEPYNKETREIYMNARQNKDNPSTNLGWENGIPNIMVEGSWLLKIMVKLSLVDIILICKLGKAEVENLRQSLQWIHACGNCNMQMF